MTRRPRLGRPQRAQAGSDDRDRVGDDRSRGASGERQARDRRRAPAIHEQDPAAVHAAIGGQAENFIKELKLDVAADRLSCHAYRANALRLQIHALAYNLLTLFRRVALGATALAKATLGTIRLKLFKVGARVQRSVRRLWYHLPAGWPGQDVYLAVVDRLLTIRPPP